MSEIGRHERLRRQILPPLLMIAAFWLIVAALHWIVGGTFAGSSVYNSYTLQAMAWREGKVSLGMDHPHLELAVLNNDWYVSFPPVPSVPMYLLTFVFGLDTPDSLMVKLYVMIAVIAIYSLLARCGWNRWHAAGMALLMALASSMLPLMLNGAVWYQAQTMAFMLTASAVALMMTNRTTPALFLYALAVGCRPFNVCYGPLLMLVWYLQREDRSLVAALRKLAPGIVLGLMVAAGYAAYNYVRFGNFLEFGHNYLPEYTRSGDPVFSMQHLMKNAKRFLIGLPLWRGDDGLNIDQFGFSLFLANPMLLILLVWYVCDLFRRKATLPKHLTIAFFAVHLFLLLMHRTGGGFQLGARYTVDIIPYSLLYLYFCRDRKGLAHWETAILSAGFALMFVGSLFVHL